MEKKSKSLIWALIALFTIALAACLADGKGTANPERGERLDDIERIVQDSARGKR